MVRENALDTGLLLMSVLEQVQHPFTSVGILPWHLMTKENLRPLSAGVVLVVPGGGAQRRSVVHDIICS